MNIVVLDAATLAGVSLDPLREFGTVTQYDTTSPEQLMSRIQSADVIVTNKVVLNADALSQLPNLRLICVAATGTNNIDLEAARAHNIAVTNVAGYSTPSVVLHTFTLLGNLMSNIHATRRIVLMVPGNAANCSVVWTTQFTICRANAL